MSSAGRVAHTTVAASEQLATRCKAMFCQRQQTSRAIALNG